MWIKLSAGLLTISAKASDIGKATTLDLLAQPGLQLNEPCEGVSVSLADKPPRQSTES